MRDADLPLYFRLFNEIGIIEQLGRTRFEAHLPKGLMVQHFSVLNHLIRVGDGRTPLELARAFQVPKTSMTHTLQGLESRALVEMRPNPDDGRSKRVWITEAGRSFRDEAIGRIAPDLARIEAVLAPEQVAELVGQLERLRVWLDANR